MIDSLTSLRWFAAFYVFLFHVQIRSGVFEHLTGDILGGGYAGMCFFFVLSGFVLATRYRDGVTSYAAFVAARIARIYPAFILAFLLTLPLIQQSSVPLYWANAFSNVFLLQAWTPNLWSLGINGGTWSLSVECPASALLRQTG
jgi:peptidoglycan/LPS O-acetylase OafA/YrhL